MRPRPISNGMDILSHGLWGSISFGRRSRRSFWLAFLFGILPDLASFGFYFLGVFLGFYSHPAFGAGHPPQEEIPALIHTLYSWSHSLVIFILVFGLVWLALRQPVLELLAWPLHIVFDVFTHRAEFFPTPFLWPLSDYQVSVINWTDPRVFIPNVALLALLYLWYFMVCRRRQG